ncbi:hypothetical protein Ancab_029028 [Ancistrocladus abbreviatus]
MPTPPALGEFVLNDCALNQFIDEIELPKQRAKANGRAPDQMINEIELPEHGSNKVDDVDAEVDNLAAARKGIET